MAKVPTARKGKAYPKSSTDGFMGGGGSGNGKAGSTSEVKLGSQLVRDPIFYEPEWWDVIGDEWTVGYGKATGVPAASSAITQATHLLEEGADYQVELDVAASAGTVRVQFTSGTPVDSATYGTGEHVFTMTAAAGNANIALRKDTAFDGDVTKLSVRKIIT